jgi:predicted lipid-binding transport protein (Tim44 family)
MLAVTLLMAPAFVIAAQPAYVAPQTPQAPQHDSTKAKSSHHSKTSSKKSTKPATTPAPKPAAAKDSSGAK